MTIYLAGPWACKPLVREARAKLEAAGITVNADWIDLHQDDTPMRESAYHDLEQIRGADGFVVIAVPGVKSEGKASEFMAAYLWGKRPIVVGARTQNVFYYMDQATVVETVEDAIDALHSRHRENACPVISAH